MATKKSAAAAGGGMVGQAEFAEMPPGQIVFSKQVRSPEDEKGEEFLGLVESVGRQGVIEPVAVAPPGEDGKHLCLAGERRVRAALAAGLTTIPVRIIRNMETRDAILALQLTENLRGRSSTPSTRGQPTWSSSRCAMGS